ncbi:LacI family transcriptional regulator [Cellulomonas aerilata]|uniref:LacI family transcriptional regulator n=1 Tax=Cellulomonas aerilata TaxID=515326 RepID=A0A512DG53_9CELL|nr:LacI family transcriptional regulator [Cellulomonas aerilata]
MPARDGAAPGPVRRATIKDVAEAAGVSRSTASRALTGRGYVGLGVRERVQHAAEGLGYVPDATARHLKQQVSRSIGVLVSDLRNSFYADLAAGISQQARRRGYTMMLADDNGSAADEVAAAERFVALRVAGVVVTPVAPDVVAYLSRHRVPLVEVDRQFGEGASDAVLVDNKHASRRVTEHLIGLGHRRIALLIDEMEWTTGRERHAGYEEACRAAGLPLEESLVVAARWDAGAARAAAADLLRRPDPPTAIFAANNLLAEAVWRAAADLGVRLPDDLSLASFDDAPWMSMVTPQVTAVEQDAVALGETAVTRLLERIEAAQAPPRTVMLGARVLQRGSTGPPPARAAVRSGSAGAGA